MHGKSGHGHKRMQRLIEVCLLVLLSSPECERCHGYALGERLRGFGFDDSEISVATLYRTLRKMEEAGWVTSDWAEGGPGPQRREYAVTDAGREALDAWAMVLQSRRERITRVLDAYTQLGRQPAQSVSESELFSREHQGGGHHHNGEKKMESADIKLKTESVATEKDKKADRLHEYWD